jgi:N-acetylmuramoyl-L-alanine amidase
MPLRLVVAAIVVGGGRQSILQRLHLSAPATKALDLNLFAKGSCEAFARTTGNSRLTMFLDIGHGGTDPAGVGTSISGTTIDEADEPLAVELADLRAKTSSGK